VRWLVRRVRAQGDRERDMNEPNEPVMGPQTAQRTTVGHGSPLAETALDGRGNSSRWQQSLLRGTDAPATRAGANVGDAGTAAGRSVRGGGPATPVGQTSRPCGRPGGGGSARYEDKEV
jgi:hypothetical protein